VAGFKAPIDIEGADLTSSPSFEAPLAEPTKPEGKVNARFSNGKTAAWQVVHVAK
jgi:hypothetical protein